MQLLHAKNNNKKKDKIRLSTSLMDQLVAEVDHHGPSLGHNQCFSSKYNLLFFVFLKSHKLSHRLICSCFNTMPASLAIFIAYKVFKNSKLIQGCSSQTLTCYSHVGHKAGHHFDGRHTDGCDVWMKLWGVAGRMELVDFYSCCVTTVVLPHNF